MTAYLVSRGAEVGLYSTAQQWAQIVGSVPDRQPARRPGQLAGRRRPPWPRPRRPARSRPLVPGGRVTLTQYVQGGLDRNQSCV